MAGRDGREQTRKAGAGRRVLVGVGAGAGVILAAAAMATGSAITAPPAHADFEALIDPIIQPILSSLTDSISAVDPAAATDLTSWTDSLLNSLNSFDLALPSTGSALAAASTAAEPAASTNAAVSSTSGTYDIPITMEATTEPTVQATVDGSSTTDLVDTGSSGLVIPWEDLGSSSELSDLVALGLPNGIGVDGYSGGVNFIYLTYDNATVNYGGGLGTTAPIDVEIFSWPTTLSSSETLQQYFTELFDNGALTSFLSGNHVNGILGIGDYNAGFLGVGASAGPTESPLQAAGFTGVTVDLPQNQLIVSDSNPGTPIDMLSGAPTPSTNLTETVTDGSTVIGSATVSDNIDSGGVYGTIPASLAPSGGVPNGDTISVYDGSTLLYSYTVANDGGFQLPNESPEVLPASDTSSGVTSIDSGYEAFLRAPVFIDYANDTLSFDQPLS